MNAPRILIAEDEPSLRMGLVDGLRAEGFAVEECADGEAALKQAGSGAFDAMVLDLMLPRLDGFEVLRRLRGDRVDLPVLILSARGEESDRILGFEYGADDYVVKPCPLREVGLRLHAILKRTTGTPSQPEHASFGAVEVDFPAYTLTRAGKRFGLNRKEIELLHFFLDHAGENLDRARLLKEVWGLRGGTASRTVDTHVFRLRQKIETDADHPEHILTVRGLGYRFEPGSVTEV